LSWLSPGGGRGIVALDLLNCTSVQSAPSLTHPIAHDDVGAVAAREQSNEVTGMLLVDMLVPFHMMYADGVERLAAESTLERRKWENRIWYVIPSSRTLFDAYGHAGRSSVGQATYRIRYLSLGRQLLPS
jgi:hypothetical protein